MAKNKTERTFTLTLSVKEIYFLREIVAGCKTTPARSKELKETVLYKVDTTIKA